MKYKLLAIDMDGTFLNEEKKLTEANLEAVRKVASAGVKVVICSGRMPAGLKPFLKYMPQNQPVIAVNGSIILDHNNKEISYEAIDNETVIKVIDLLRSEFKEVYYHFFDKNAACSEVFEKMIKEYNRRNSFLSRDCRVELRIIPDTKEYIKQYNASISKIEICDDNSEILQKIRKRIREVCDVEVVSVGSSGIEITKSGLNKGSSLETLAKHYGYSLEECIAIGNDENDIEMIKKAGLGIAVKNAREDVKKAANYITEKDNNNDAVAEIIEKFIELPV
jgi:Cof subfamily protein (haloacid dehalogenase superfamily)